MKTIFYGFCLIFVVVSGLVFYFALQRIPVVNVIRVPTTKPSRVFEQGTSVVEQKLTTSNKKKCACCREKLAQSRKIAKQRWAQEMLASYGYEEGMKRIAAKDPGLAKRIQEIFDREKYPNLAPAVAQSSVQ